MYMKSSIVFTSLCFVLSLLSCQDTREDLKIPSSELLAYKGVGHEIPSETGMRWIELYHEKEKSNGRSNLLGLLGYEVSAGNMEALLQSIPDVIGVAFHYGLDQWGNRHIMVIPIDGSLLVWASIPGRIILDANNNTIISQSTAQAWALDYQAAHPDEVWFHFFGSNIFDDMVQLPYFHSIDIQPALSDLNLSPQMLLIIWNNPLDLLFGRTKGSNCTVYDASNACPPCGVH
jgi:hypothetical protein